MTCRRPHGAPPPTTASTPFCTFRPLACREDTLFTAAFAPQRLPSTRVQDHRRAQTPHRPRRHGAHRFPAVHGGLPESSDCRLYRPSRACSAWCGTQRPEGRFALSRRRSRVRVPSLPSFEVPANLHVVLPTQAQIGSPRPKRGPLSDWQHTCKRALPTLHSCTVARTETVHDRCEARGTLRCSTRSVAWNLRMAQDKI